MAIGSMTLLPGCAYDGYDDYDNVQVWIGSGPVYADYAPGYYYDNAYYDRFGRWYPRTYYYYDGHRWNDRHDIPHGAALQRRHDREERAERERRERRDHHEDHRNDHHDNRQDFRRF